MQNKIYMPRGQRALRVLERRVKNPLRLIDDFYRAMWYSGWYGDGAMRMSTYYHLTENLGMRPLEAGQMTAYWHGAYDQITPGARGIVNKVFFTPTFKYAMGHLQANMTMGAMRFIDDVTKLKKPSARDIQLAKGLMIMSIMQYAKGEIMKSLGFTTELFGLKFVKTDVETEEGEKELVVYMPDPGNVIPRLLFKWHGFFADIDDPERLDAFANKMKWDLHPLWQLTTDVLTNSTGETRTMKGDVKTHIYSEFDDESKQAWDIFHYSVSKIIAIGGYMERKAGLIGSKEAYKALQREIGKVNAFFLDSVSLAYLRNPHYRRQAGKARAMERRFKEMYAEDINNMSEEQAKKRMKNFFDDMQKIMDEKKPEKEPSAFLRLRLGVTEEITKEEQEWLGSP
jgi:hypothetical protein